jgi:hypothetical protein
MSTVEGEANAWEERASRAPDPPRDRFLGWFIRALARLWVVSLVLVTAAAAGIAVYELNQTYRELHVAREEPGAASYAVVAYRRELARQVDNMKRDEVDYLTTETLPVPPERPRQLADIDSLREDNAAIRRAALASRSEDGARPRRGEPRIPD